MQYLINIFVMKNIYSFDTFIHFTYFSNHLLAHRYFRVRIFFIDILKPETFSGDILTFNPYYLSKLF